MLTDAEKVERIKEWLGKTEIDESVVGQTLGIHESHLSPQLLLESTKKLIKINKLEVEPDNRDDLRYSTFHGLEDYVDEHIIKDAGKYQQKAKLKMQQKKDLSWLQSGFFSPQIRSIVVGGSQLSQNIEGHNPIDFYDASHKTTKLGPGGISSIDATPDECYDEGTEVFTSLGWIGWDKVNDETLFACRMRGQLEFHKAYRLISKSYTGNLLGIKTRTLDILVTPNHRMWTRKYRGNSTVANIGLATWEFSLMQDCINKPRQFQITHAPYVGEVVKEITIPLGKNCNDIRIFNVEDFAELVGWYASEGSIPNPKGSKYSKIVCITQSPTANPDKLARIDELLSRMQLRFKRYGKNFLIRNRSLREYLAINCGVDSLSKKLSTDVFSFPHYARQKTHEALLLGDGHSYENGHAVYHSISEQLIEDVIRLTILNGKAARRCLDYDREDDVREVSKSCSILISDIQGVTSERMYDKAYYQQDYDGLVYCAEVPGELLYVRRNGAVPMWSGNSRQVHSSYFGLLDPMRISETRAVGIDHRFAHNVVKGRDNKIYKLVLDKDKKPVWISHETMLSSKVEIPEN